MITPKPRLFPFHPKPKRLPERKRVTAILTFIASDGIVFCADTQETVSEQFKTNTRKICSCHTEKFQLVVGGSGDSDWVDMSIDHLMKSLAGPDVLQPPVFHWPTIEKIINEHVQVFFRKYIKQYAADPVHRPSADLLIAINSISGRMILRTYNNTVNKTFSYDAVGAGATLARDLASRLWDGSLTMKQTASLAIYILDRVKSSVPGCGGNTDVALLGIDRKFTHIPTKRVKELEMIHADIEVTAFEQMVKEITKHDRTLRL